jgi:hypothetical protein
MTRARSRLLATAIAGAATLLLLAPVAQASNCTLDSINSPQTGADPALFDSQGYEWDTTAPPPAPTRDSTFATLFDAGSNDGAGTPPGPRTASDSYDEWGGLFIGGDAVANLYFSADNNSCAYEDASRELAFPVLTINGLQVQRKLFVSSSGLVGVRLLELVTNPGSAAATTSVQVGDTQSSNNDGDLGSDTATAVRLDSDGNNAIDTNDLWLVTSDSATTNVDLALAHVLDGAGGGDRVDFATLTGTDADAVDNLAYRWDNVTIPPGQTAAFISYEIQQGVAGAAAATEIANAASQAQAYEALPFAQIYAAMSDAEIAAVRNWPKPGPTVSIGAVSGAGDNAPVNFTSAVVASSTAGICGTASLNWDFGDGSSGTGSSPSHRFKAGTYNVKLTATNSCGGSATATRQVAVADKSAPSVSESVKRSIKLRTLVKRGLLVKLTSSEDARASLTGRIPSSLAKKASLSRVSRTVLRKRASLVANTSRKLRLKPKKKAARALKKLVKRAHRKGVRVTLTTVVRDSGGHKTTVRKRVKVKR